MNKDPVSKYLADYAEPEIKMLKSMPKAQFKHVLLLPAYKENHDFLEPYLNSRFSNLLLILVINQPDTDDNIAPQQALYAELCNQTMTIWEDGHLSLHPLKNASAILCIRRFEDELRLPNKQGVGLARKIAADCAVQLIHNHQISSRWIASTDADATLPTGYFNDLDRNDIAAQTFEYHHEVNQGPVSQATQAYQISLRYFQAGLAWAGSPYALHTLGSCLAVHAPDYVHVRGFPKRSGGEDFYLLNKLNKIGKIVHRQDIKITIQSRESERVPFGTGPAVKAILKLDNVADYQYYHPAVFEELKHCLESLRVLQVGVTFDDWQQVFDTLHVETLLGFGLERIFEHQKQQNISQENLQHNLFIWFDGLLTLRFIHAMRDQKHHNIPLLEALEKAPFYAT